MVHVDTEYKGGVATVYYKNYFQHITVGVLISVQVYTCCSHRLLWVVICISPAARLLSRIQA